MNYDWVKGVAHLCRCGRVGVWAWEKNEFEVWHNINDSCRFKTITSREEHALRVAVPKSAPRRSHRFRKGD